MDLTTIPTELDSAVLGSKDQYAEYFKIVDRALTCLVNRNHKLLDESMFSPLEIEYTIQYGRLLLSTLAKMRLRYMYDEDRNLQIDTTLSGWPHYNEIRFMINDLEFKKTKLEQLPSKKEVKAYMLKYLLEHKEAIPDLLMHKAALAHYYTTIDEKELFKQFIQGKVKEYENGYMVSWAFYDIANNRPYIFFMEFEYAGQDMLSAQSTDRIQLNESIKRHAYRMLPLHLIATQIDAENPNIKPTKVKCVDLGLLFSVFTRDDHEATGVLLDAIKQKELPPTSFAFLVRIDVLISGGEKVINKDNLFFKSTQRRMQYMVKNEKYGSTFHHEYLFAPHRVLQTFTERIPNFIRALTKKVNEESSSQLQSQSKST